jgi:hypothetical protein
VFVNCSTYRNGSYGFAALGTGLGTACNLIACHSYGIGQTWAYWLGTTGNNLVGCTGEGAGSDATTGGQVFIGANDNTIQGGLYYSAVAPYDTRGIVIGGTEGGVTYSNVTSTFVDTSVVSCNGGAFVFGSDTGSKISGRVYQSTGNVYSGTPDTSTTIDLSVGGAATFDGNLPNTLRVGNSAAATTPGSVVKKIQVFDEHGVSLGYLPVYNGIT